MTQAHFIYLIPSDLSDRASVEIDKAAKHLQRWLWFNLGIGKTFNLAPTRAIHVSEDRHWFANHPNGDNPNGYFWNNCLDAGNRYAGAGFGDPDNTWVLWVDAQMNAGQYTGATSAGGLTGVAVLDKNDISGLFGQNGRTVCREIGGAGHELLHTLGLPHPDGDPDFSRALMGTGYTIYPTCILTSDEVTFLSNHPLIVDHAPLPPVRGMCPFSERRIRPPRPRPYPLPRP